MFYEFNHFGFSEYFCKEYGNNFNFPLHLHHSFEVIVVLEGTMEVTIDDTLYQLKQGESVMIFPNQLHALKSEHSRHMLCIFSPELVKAYSSKVQKARPVFNQFSLDAYVIAAMDSLREDATIFEKKGILYTVCAMFDKSASYTNRADPDKDLLHSTFSFVERNFQGECSLHELAEQTGYSYSYISRCFKKVTGISFHTYVNQYRIRNACYLLSNTDDTVLKCALDSGYTSLRSFNRNFISFLGVTPKAYREKQK